MIIRFAAFLLLLCFAAPALGAKPALPAAPFPPGEPVELLFSQQEIAVDVPDHSAPAMQFGLLGALIGTAITNAQVKRGEAQVEGLRNVLLGYPFNARMERALRDALVAGAILRDEDLRVLQTTWNADDPANADGRVVMLAPRYAVNDRFNELSVSLAISQAERNRRASGKTRQKLLFSRTYAFRFPLTESALGRDEDYAVQWSDFGRAPLEALLDEGIEQVVAMLVYDLSAEGRAEAELPNKRMVGMVGSSEFSGRSVRSGDGWIWLRSGPAAFKTLVGHRPVDAGIVSQLATRAAAEDTEASAVAAGIAEASPTDAVAAAALVAESGDEAPVASDVPAPVVEAPLP